MAEEIVRTHHERWDGSGYPLGLRGEQIPLTGRIVALVDAFDALSLRKPHRQAANPEQAYEEIQSQSGRYFDPDVVDALTALPFDLLLEKTGGVEAAVSAAGRS